MSVGLESHPQGSGTRFETETIAQQRTFLPSLLYQSGKHWVTSNASLSLRRDKNEERNSSKEQVCRCWRKQGLYENILNLMKTKTHKNLWNAGKAEHKRQFKVLNDHVRKKVLKPIDLSKTLL